jgi:hypothetical protein
VSSNLDTVARGRAQGHHGGGEPDIELVISPQDDGRVVITAKADADLGELGDFLSPWNDDPYVFGMLCGGCARKLLRPIIDRPWALDRGANGDIIELWTLAERRALLDTLGRCIH